MLVSNGNKPLVLSTAQSLDVKSVPLSLWSRIISLPIYVFPIILWQLYYYLTFSSSLYCLFITMPNVNCVILYWLMMFYCHLLVASRLIFLTIFLIHIQHVYNCQTSLLVIPVIKPLDAARQSLS